VFGRTLGASVDFANDFNSLAAAILKRVFAFTITVAITKSS
jgi:hypothetical protein